MVELLQARKVSIDRLIDKFNLEFVEDLQFFSEWQTDLPELQESERQALDKIRQGFLNLLNHPPLLERTIQLSVLGPMLFLADFYLPPFHVHSEQPVEIVSIDEDITIRGTLDALLLKDRFWAIAIESKEAAFSIEAGRAQLLSYMLANPDSSRPCYGMIAAGGGFVFLKLISGDRNQYALSRVYMMQNPGNDLYEVYRIMKRIAQKA
jgi:hypothetical protein